MDFYLSFLSSLIATVAVVATWYIFRVSKTVEYIARLQSPDFMASRIRLLKLFDEFKAKNASDEEKVQIVEASPQLSLDATWMLNFLQELAVGYKYGLIDHKIAFDVFDYLVLTYWEELHFLVRSWRKRETNGAFLFRRLEWLYGKYHRVKLRREARQERVGPPP